MVIFINLCNYNELVHKVKHVFLNDDFYNLINKFIDLNNQFIIHGKLLIIRKASICGLATPYKYGIYMDPIKYLEISPNLEHLSNVYIFNADGSHHTNISSYDTQSMFKAIYVFNVKKFLC